jgi:conjugative relaxase-like TrwC/TraI family protein
MNAISSLDYYSDLASEDYYTSGGEPAGIWSGLGARLLELNGQIDNSEYRSIFRGYAPDGTALCERPGDGHRSGWDLTFSAPKSVSILWARSDANLRQEIQAGQLKAVRQALAFIEKHAAVTRRGHAGYKQEAVTGLVAALFEHSTSRAQDPQLHTHCLIANVAPRTDGSWGTIESRQLFLWQKAAGAVYRSTLANHLREIGFEISQPETASHFEVEGIPQGICERFSKRAEAIEAALADLNIASSASHIGNAVKLTTRTHKQSIDRPALFKQWHQELDEHGLSADQAQALRSAHPEINAEPLPISTIAEQMVEKRSVFRLQDLYEALAVEAQWSHAELHDIETAAQQLIEEREVVALGRDEANSELFSTPSMISKERALVRLADQLQSQTHYQLSDEIIERAISAHSEIQGFSLSDEQAESVFSVCQSGLDILQGAAGAGKSISMRAVKSAYESTGFSVIGATVARQAANQLETETAINSKTIAKLLSEIKGSNLSLENTVVLVDEAGQISTLDLLRLASAVHQARGKLILVGEEQQMDAITHGGSLRYLSQRQGCARIQTIRRQNELWAREAIRQFRAGNALEALQAHQERGLLHFADNSADARELLVNRWREFQQQNPEKDSMILAQRWRDVIPLNEAVRNCFQEQGKVGQEDIETSCAVSNHTVRCQFSSGERVRFTRNDYDRGYTNGDLGTIQQVVEQTNGEIHFTVQCDNGQIAQFSNTDYCDEKGNLYLVQAYATTVYASQGTTVNGDVFVYYTSGMDRSASYVAGSRHKDNCHWFANREEIDALSGAKDCGMRIDDSQRLQILAHRMSTNRIPHLAIEFLENRKQQDRSISHHRSAPTLEVEAEIC